MIILDFGFRIATLSNVRHCERSGPARCREKVLKPAVDGGRQRAIDST
jgi:hypothetical protein